MMLTQFEFIIREAIRQARAIECPLGEYVVALLNMKTIIHEEWEHQNGIIRTALVAEELRKERLRKDKP